MQIQRFSRHGQNQEESANSCRVILKVSSLYKRFQSISETEIPGWGLKCLWFEFSIQEMLNRGFLPESLRNKQMLPFFGSFFFLFLFLGKTFFLSFDSAGFFLHMCFVLH